MNIFTICAFICFVLSTIWKYTLENEEIPQFWSLPDPEIYEDDSVRDLTVQVIVSPANTTLFLGVMHIGSGGSADEIKLLDFNSFSSSLSSNSVRVIIKAQEIVGVAKSQEKWTLKIIRYQSVFDKSLHILAKNQLGTVMSRPFKIIRKVLNPFPLVHHESVGFLMGNVGQVVCMLPHSKPSPPNIEFLKDNEPINVTRGSRYKKVYVHAGAMILLIRNIRPQDRGSYTCTASLFGTTTLQKSDKITRLSVTTPTMNLKPRFRLSSHENERGGSSRIIEVLEGQNITLYCLYESAPVIEVTWYWPNNNRKYEVDAQFGTLVIPNVQKEDASDFSCSAEDVIGRTFSLHVLEIPRFTSTPFEISFEEYENKSVTLKCEIQNESTKISVKWFHNGRIINENVDRNKFLGNVLIINKLSREYLGIYQCWLENDGNLWATGATVIRNIERINNDLNPLRENTSIIDKRTPPGLTVHLECSLPQSQMDTIADFSVKWFRRIDSLEPIDLISNKYMIFKRKSEKKVFLSILNPTKSQDEGIYVCRLYGTNANLLNTITFRLSIDDQKLNEPGQYESSQGRAQVKKNIVSAPDVSKVTNYLLAVILKWKVLLDDIATSQIYHYRIQYQRKQLAKMSRKDPVDQTKSEEWSEEKMLDEYTTNNQITIIDRHIFHPYSQIRFRVKAIPKVSSPIHSTSGSNETMIDNLSSVWSKPVSFDDILNCKLSISKNRATPPTTVLVMWTHTCVKEPHWQNVVFNVVYASITDCIKSNKCQTDGSMKTYESMLVLPEYRLLLHTLKIDGEFGEFLQANVTGLKPNSQYVMAIYGQVTSLSQEVSFISLSNSINVTTGMIVLNENKGNDNEDIIITDNDDSRNRVIFLVLGSLAGVLFVVAAVMFGMCTWYYMKKHMKIHKAQLKPNDLHQPSLLFHYPLPSPMCYGTRIEPLNHYQSSQSNTSNKLLYFPSQNIGKSPISSCVAQQNDLWSVNFLGQSPKTMVLADKFSSDQDSDMDSMCTSDRMTHSNARRNVVMGADQASSTYSRVGSERRLSMGPTNTMPEEYSSNFQNFTLPRHCMIPISFPDPPTESNQGLFPFSFLPNSEIDSNTGAQTDIIDENGSSVPFLNSSRGCWNGSVTSCAKKDYCDALKSKFTSDSTWMADTYYDAYSSNSSSGNESTQLKSMIQTYT